MSATDRVGQSDVDFSLSILPHDRRVHGYLRQTRLSKPTKSGQLFFKLLLPAGIIGGIKTIRTIPISDLFASAGMAQILGTASVKTSAIDEKTEELCQSMQPFWIAMTLAGFGAYAMTMVIPPEIPQDSAAFQPPLKAIEFIDKNRPPGRMLNDPHFGNVLMWKVDKTLPVFIDSRYNLYGNTLFQSSRQPIASSAQVLRNLSTSRHRRSRLKFTVTKRAEGPKRLFPHSRYGISFWVFLLNGKFSLHVPSTGFARYSSRRNSLSLKALLPQALNESSD